MTAPFVPRTEQINIEAQTQSFVLPTRFVGKLTKLSTTPSVKNVEGWITQNTAPITILNFVDGQLGQELKILGDGFTSVANNTTIKNNTGATKLLAIGKAYTFTLFDGVWIEDE